MRHFYVLSLTVLALALTAAAATAATLRGLVRDRESRETLIGVDVTLVGTGQKTMTDIDGRFEFADLAAGEYELRCTYLGYNTRFLSGVKVAAAGGELVVDMEGFRAHQADDMIISGTRVLSTEGALLADRKQAAVIGDAISAAQISRSPDGTSGDALKRVPGLVVNEGKYVFVRGVSDRYNVTEINGVTMSGTNVAKDRKSFNFDMVPANLLANVAVIKQATPDLPGDFAGGLVRVTTLEFPEESTTSFGFSVGRTAATTGQPFRYDAMRGDTDWLGIDDGGREFPRALLDSSVVYQNLRLQNPDLARALPNRWTTEQKSAPPKLSFNLSHGNKLQMAGLDVGYMGAVAYGHKAEIEDEQERRIGDSIVDASGKTYLTEASLNGLANVFLRQGRHRIGLTNLYNRVAEGENTFVTGVDQTAFEWQTLAWHERYQFVDKIDGKHHLPGPGGGFELDWQGYYGESHAAEPDRRYLNYVTDIEPYGSYTRQMNENMRMWSWLDEFRRGLAVNLAWTPAADEFEKQFNLEVKAGYRRDRRSRAFDVEAWYTDRTRSSRFNTLLTYLPPDSIFAAENYNEVSDPRRGTLWEFQQDTNLSGTYQARHDLEAWYAMLDLPFSLLQEDLRLTGGARVEESDQLVESVRNKLIPSRVDTSRVDTRDVLPSVSLTWLYDERTNVRLGYYASVNRPEFREMSPVLRRDYRTFTNQQGNEKLKRARIRNYDVRVERFPAPGEVIAASAFYKRIADAIEDTLRTDGERPTTTYISTPRAVTWGFETEVRKKLDWFALTEDVTLAANYTRVWSEVVFDDASTQEVVEHNIRPLQGQAPWSVNVSLSYENPGTRTTVSALYNKVGRRLDKLTDREYTYIYLEPRDRLDLVATQRFRRYKVKLAVADVLSANRRKTSSTADGVLYDYSDVSENTSYSLSVSGSF